MFVLITKFAWKATYQTINIETSRNAGIVIIIEPKRYADIIYTKLSGCDDIMEAKNLRIGTQHFYEGKRSFSNVNLFFTLR